MNDVTQDINSPLQQKRVLLVEDESLVLMMIEDMLFELGAADIEVAMGLEQAKRVVASSAFDVAVLDVNLAGEKSYPVAEMLRQRGIPLLFATGYGSKGHDPAWQDAPTITKPFDTRDLAKAVSSLLTHG